MEIMKKFLIILSILLLILIIGTILFLSYKINLYGEDFKTMFGDDNFYIEEIVDSSRMSELYTKVVNFCVPRSEYEKEFETLESYLSSLGYRHHPDEQEGTCWFFYNKNGDKVIALRSVYNNYLEWKLLWEK